MGQETIWRSPGQRWPGAVVTQPTTQSHHSLQQSDPSSYMPPSVQSPLILLSLARGDHWEKLLSEDISRISQYWLLTNLLRQLCQIMGQLLDSKKKKTVPKRLYMKHIPLLHISVVSKPFQQSTLLVDPGKTRGCSTNSLVIH